MNDSNKNTTAIKELYILIITCILVAIVHTRQILKVQPGAVASTTGRAVSTFTGSAEMSTTNDISVK
jgi:hypothetical protein